ncbi:TPA: toxin PIN [Enterococcus faecium]|uniref:toxin PIN n=1 Tax=Enterococcus faecium TaxID=1352 RepID=UPI001890E999|nr:toxin PIN [Enterococcus faecium]MBQ1085633.1 toxin PIN [Enterococcus faecium]MBQ1086477.1 toxin PIN [Enterococcus faecium]MCU2000746.1 toxin PIN [Enterococcus faecium]MCU2006186.1 toxin PIN [Enterococcus faecium]MCU2145407.1 toxin PIN [Enterococcus faecium]
MNNRHRRITKLRKQELNVLKTKFEKEYGVSVEEAYKVASQCVAIASDAIRKFGILILSDDRKWEEKE